MDHHHPAIFNRPKRHRAAFLVADISRPWSFHDRDARRLPLDLPRAVFEWGYALSK